MTKRASFFAVAIVALLGAACASPIEGTVDFGEGRRFVPAIADTLDDVGLMPEVALDAEGVPYVVYFGFPQELEEGEIPVTRPVTAPFVPSVLLVSQSEGIFTKGAVAMVEEPPTGVTIPFGPVAQPELESITPDNVGGTAIATDESGGLHVTYVTDSGLYYGKGGAGTSFEVELVLPIKPKLDQAGPVGPPAIAVDADGNPWIAYGLSQGGRQRVEVATSEGGRFVTQVVAPLDPCAGCPPPQRVGIGVTDDGPMVTYTDPRFGGPIAAAQPQLSRDTRVATASWVEQRIDAGGGGFGLSMAVDGGGTPTVSYYDDAGVVHVATRRGASWSAEPVAEVGPSEEPFGEGGLVTGLAVDDEGVRTVAYVDVASDAVAASSDAEGEFAPLDVSGTLGGQYPSVDVSADGASMYLTWFDAVNADLGLGTFAETGELAVARPSPTPSVTAAPPATDGGSGSLCKPEGTTADVVAPVGAAVDGFAEDCVAVEAKKPFTVNFDNQDTGIQHNVAVYTDSAATQEIAVGEIITGPAQDTIDGDAQDAGEYFFRCDVHPGTMFGTFVTA